MAGEHLLDDREENIKSKCLYCNKPLNASKWRSYHHGEIHYKVIQCSCGKHFSTKVDFHGSGHDSWNKRNVANAASGNAAAKEDNVNIEDKIVLAESDHFKEVEDEVTTAVERNVEMPFNVLVGNLVKKFKNVESWRVMKFCNSAKKKSANKTNR